VTVNDVKWPQKTGTDPEVTSFDRKLPGSGCRRPKTPVYCTFHFQQGCHLQEEVVTCQEMTSDDLNWPKVSRKWSHLTGSHLEVAVEEQKLIYCTFHLLQGSCSQEEAVTWQEMTSRDFRWPEVTLKWRHLTGSHLEVAVEGQKLAMLYISLPTRL